MNFMARCTSLLGWPCVFVILIIVKFHSIKIGIESFFQQKFEK